MPSIVFNETLDQIARGGLAAVERDNLRVMLVRPGYQPDPAQEFVDDESRAAPAAHELDALGYARRDLKNVRLVLDERPPFLDADDVDFGEVEAGERIFGVVIFNQGTIDRSSRLLAFLEFERTGRGRSPATTGGPVTLTWSETGFLSLRSGTPAPVTARAALAVDAIYAQRNPPQRHDGGGGR